MITQSELKSVAHYDEQTGVFTRRTSKGGFHIGTPMGRTDTYGYKQLSIAGKAYLAHRAAWLYVNGEWPKDEIDHIDCNPLNNAIANLRESTRKGNVENVVRARKTSLTGVLGISPKDGKYQVRIGHNRKQYYIGFFNTKEEAHDAYVVAKRKLHEFNTL